MNILPRIPVFSLALILLCGCIRSLTTSADTPTFNPWNASYEFDLAEDQQECEHDHIHNILKTDQRNVTGACLLNGAFYFVEKPNFDHYSIFS